MPRPKDSMFFGFADKMTKEQKIYVDSIFDKRVTFVNAKSGTGKTTLAVASAKLLGNDLVYIFAPVQERTMGFRPGNQNEKEKDYLVPLIDALKEINENPNKVIFNEENMDALKNGDVWVFPMSHVFARGTNIKGKTVIIDEAQNFTVKELRKILTRIHDDCKVIIIGHVGQIDLDKPSKSGFSKYIKHLGWRDYASVCELTVNFRGVLANDADEIDEDAE